LQSGGGRESRSAATLGWSADFLATVTWGVGSALAGAGGILVAPIIGINTTDLRYWLIPVTAAALVGGFSSFPLTLLVPRALV